MVSFIHDFNILLLAASVPVAQVPNSLAVLCQPQAKTSHMPLLTASKPIVLQGE